MIQLAGRQVTETMELIPISSTNLNDEQEKSQNNLKNKRKTQCFEVKKLPSERRNTNTIILTNIHYKNKNIRERQTQNQLTTEKKKSIFEVQNTENKHSLTCTEKFKKEANYIMDLPITIIIMSILTLFALFLSDIQTAWCPPSCDFPFDIIQLFVFISFTIEICLCTYVDPTYGCSLFFWLDTISTLSLFLDVNFISDKFLGTKIFLGNTKYKYQLALSKISTASGTTRVLRILRIVKLIRVVKLYKSVYQAKTKMIKAEEKKKKQLKLLLLNSTNKSSSSSSTPETEDKLNTSGQQVSISKKFSSELSKKRLMSPLKKTQIFKVLSPEKEKEEEKEKKDDFEKIKQIKDVTEETIKESRISKILTDSLNKKIFCVVMVVLIIYPFLSEDFYITNTDSISYSLLSNYLESYYIINNQTFNRFFENYVNASVDSFFPIINITLNGTLIYHNKNITKTDFRNDEIRTYISPDFLIEITFSMFKETTLNATLNFFRTLFVCILVTMSVWFIEGDAKKNVLEPLEIMMEIIDKVSSDPVNAKNINAIQSGTKATIEKYEHDDNKEENYEIKIIKQSIIKISALLSMGFGEIGAEIIKKNLINDTYNFKEKGKMIAGIYGYFNIRNYSKINKQFKKNSIILINHIAEIIHDSVAMYSGNITKNFGESVLAIWKFTSNNFTVNENQAYSSIKDNNVINKEKLRTNRKSYTLKSEETEIKNKMNKKLNSKTLVPKSTDNCTKGEIINEDLTVLMENITDLALFSCLRIYHKIQKKSNSYFTDPSNKISIGFSLHLGSSIEGVIGSSLKIDTVHLSRNTIITEKLNDLSIFYGVDFIFTDEVYNHLSDTVKEFCRIIDIITFSSISKSYRIYTIDINKKLSLSTKPHVYLSRYEKELLHNEKKKKLYETINSVGNVSYCILSRHSFQEVLESNYSEDFFMSWKKGFMFYEKGEWEKAKEEFTQCHKIDPEDKPCLRLLEHMEKFNYHAPCFWDGSRHCPK